METSPAKDERRNLPSVGKLLDRSDVREALDRLPRNLILDCLRTSLNAARTSANGSVQDVDSIVIDALTTAQAKESMSLRRAINATGVVLHTGLGRAVLCESARRAVDNVMTGHSVLEIEESGRRGSRQEHVKGLLREFTGAESALVVNNNAGAVFLGVTALASGKEVVISRGELIEIGGAFRMPDIIKASGATLVEVGTTNRTRLKDFEQAITERTGLLLRCHPSNFKVVGFTEEVSGSRLAELGRKHGIPTMDDLGSGALIETASLGAAHSATMRQAVESGCDIVTASGDKLLGGPQCGIILGRSESVDRIAKHPLARALRVDKLTLAALEGTLHLYRDPERAKAEIPTLRYLMRSKEELANLALRLRSAVSESWQCDLVDEQSQVGGGSLPGESLPTVCLRIRVPDKSPEWLASALRENEPPIFGRIHEDSVLLDPRTLEESEIEEIGTAFSRFAARQ